MPNESNNQIFTIGHSDNSIERFIELLRLHAISALADVRSSPFSRFHSHFNRDELQASLRAARIAYVPLGLELGARRSEPECYVDGKARYELIATAPLFQEGLHRVIKGAARHRIALMCAEKDPITCHRAILVCRYLRPSGVPISHILHDGKLETTDEMEQRLLDEAGSGVELFVSDRRAQIEYAYDVQGERIAFTQQTVASEQGG